MLLRLLLFKTLNKLILLMLLKLLLYNILNKLI